MTRRRPWRAILLAAVFALAAPAAHALPGLAVADPFEAPRQKLRALAPGDVVWKNPRGLFVCGLKPSPSPGALATLRLLEKLLATPLRPAPDAKTACPLRVTLTSPATPRPLVLDITPRCPPGQRRCQILLTHLDTSRLAKPHQHAFFVAYEYLVDAGLMGAARP